MTPVLIFAGTKAQADHFSSFYVEANNSRQLCYVDDIDQIRGLHGATAVIYGTFYERKDWHKILMEARSHDFVLLRLP